MNTILWQWMVCVLVGLAQSGPLLPELQEYQQAPTTEPADTLDEDLMGPEIKDESDVHAYFTRYGYTSRSDYADKESLIRMLQDEGGLPVTGVLDEATKKLMRYPRCGFSAAMNGMKRRRKRYVLHGSRWNQPLLTYRTSQNTNKLPTQQAEQIIDQAFKTWSDAANLKFEKRQPTERVDIDIRFAAREHGDRSPFDGPGSTLAHAYFPRFGGDAHFDEDERWTDRDRRGVNLLQVAVHEFGHSLGLEHSRNQNAIMAAFYRGYDPNFKLDADDIAGIQSLYGAPNTPGPAPTRPPTPGPAPTRPPTQGPAPTQRPTTTQGGPSSCDIRFDAVATARLGNGRSFTYAFRGYEYFIIDSNKPPRNIRQDFSYIDTVPAAISIKSSSESALLYIFKGNQIYIYTVTVDRYNRHTITFSRLLSVSQGIPGLPDNVDAIVNFRGQYYAFKGSSYYRITKGHVDRGYPRDLSVWQLPSSVRQIDSVVTYENDRVYFFTGTEYYRYQSSSYGVDGGYPRPIGRWWLRCFGNINQASTTEQTSTEGEMEEGKQGFTDIITVLEEEEKEGRVGAATTNTAATILVMLSAVVTVILLSGRS